MEGEGEMRIRLRQSITSRIAVVPTHPSSMASQLESDRMYGESTFRPAQPAADKREARARPASSAASNRAMS